MTSRIPSTVLFCLTTIAISAPPVSGQIPDNIVPLRSFDDLAAPPKSVTDLIKRYGDVTVPEGRTEKGDRETEPVRERLSGWLKPAGPPSAAEISAMMQGGGRMTPAAGQAIGALVQAANKMTGDFTQAVQAYGLQTVPPVRAAYEAKLDQIYKTYNPLIEKCLGKHERAGGASCADPTPRRDAEINAAGDAYLGSADSTYAEYKNRLKQIAAQGEQAIDYAAHNLGGSPPPLARTQIRSIRQNEINALLAALTAETDLVVYVHNHIALPRQQTSSP